LQSQILETADGEVGLAPDVATGRRGPVLELVRPPLHRSLPTIIVAVGPWVVAALLLAGVLGERFPLHAMLLAVVFYVVMGHGITVGFHRLFTHRSFQAKRPLKIALAVAGSMALQGSIIGWVADHRRHHRYPDRPGDPHSPVWRGTERLGRNTGLWHAHAGWFFNSPPTSREDYAPDLLADRDLVIIDRLFIPLTIATLALPFALGYVITGTWSGAFAAFIWAGVLRIGFSHNFTWSINSICHRFGKRPFRTDDESTNVAALALFTAGESFHNAHHAFPTLARHGVEPRQIDTSAAVIRAFERLGWASQVRWPTPALLDARRAAPTGASSSAESSS
jgi:stearoyl-CoA desaturase (delta-9 desaturase)